MVARRALAERQPNQAHFFNANSLLKKLTPAVPDHAQIAAEAGIADYFDALHARHFKDAVAPAERGQRVHALMRGQELALAAPLPDWLRQRNDVRVLVPTAPAQPPPPVAIHTQTHPAPQAPPGLSGPGLPARPGHPSPTPA